MHIRIKQKNLTADISTDRFDLQNIEAHKKLNMQITADCEPYTPFQHGELRSQIRYPDGLAGDTIEWYAPYAHYQYYGELYLAENGSSWAKKYEEKYPSGRLLSYRTPGTGSMWFESAKMAHKQEWIALTKRIAGGG